MTLSVGEFNLDGQQGFVHSRNAFHQIPDSAVLAALLHTAMKPLRVQQVPGTAGLVSDAAEEFA